MIRFRTGHSWKTEGDGQPRDSFAFEVGGLNLVEGATDEPLEAVVPELIDALLRLAQTGSAQVSLPESHTELCFLAHGGEVECHVVPLSRPARVSRGPLRLDYPELARAAQRCGTSFLEDARRHAPSAFPSGHQHPLERALQKLSEVDEVLDWTSDGPGVGYCQSPRQLPGVGFVLRDPLERIRSFRPLATGALPSLLVEGELQVRVSPEKSFRLPGYPLLLCTEIERQASALLRAAQHREEMFCERLAGVGPTVRVHLRTGRIEMEECVVDVSVETFIRRLLSLPQAFRFGVVSLHPPQAHNPYLLELAHRSHLALSQLREVEPSDAPRRPRTQRAPREAPLSRTGRLKRLCFDLQWERPLGSEGGPLAVELFPGGAQVSSGRWVEAYSPKGQLLFRHESPDGVASSPDGAVLVRKGERLFFYDAPSQTCRWTRSADALHPGARLHRVGHDRVLVETLPHAVTCVDVGTGKTQWAWEPPRTRQRFVSMLGPSLVCTTDSGLFGFSAHKGTLHCQAALELPAIGPALPFGPLWLTLTQQGSLIRLMAIEPRRSVQAWAFELSGRNVGMPLVHRGVCWLLAVCDGQATLLGIRPTGERAFRKTLPLDGSRLWLLPAGDDVLCTDGLGTAVRIGPDGKTRWRVGEAHPESESGARPVLSRHVLFLPGERLRALEIGGGSVLGAIEHLGRLTALKADARLRLYAMNESGVLRSFRLSSRLSLL